ncbi:MAG TPA: hypothetical protein VN397_04225 [Candidatus Methylomirabilis sp.]|nr:hypothetical protein [Candidatus Methylomirabilis sp.]
MSEFIKSKSVQVLLTVLAALILLVASFTAGVSVGERKARHFSKWSENYPRMFGTERGFRGMTPFRGAPDAHGAFGKILSVSGSDIVVQGKDGVEQNVLVSSSTEIRVGRERGGIDDIRPGDQAAVFGAPNEEGQIDARLIRLMK